MSILPPCFPTKTQIISNLRITLQAPAWAVSLDLLQISYAVGRLMHVSAQVPEISFTAASALQLDRGVQQRCCDVSSTRAAAAAHPSPVVSRTCRACLCTTDQLTVMTL